MNGDRYLLLWGEITGHIALNFQPSNFSKMPLVGALNLCFEIYDSMQRESVRSNERLKEKTFNMQEMLTLVLTDQNHLIMCQASQDAHV